MQPTTIKDPSPGQFLADSHDAQTLRESKYPAIQYIPRKDVRMNLLARIEHASYSPVKGDSSYFSISSGGLRSINAICRYECPHAAVAASKDLLAFYSGRVDSIEVTDIG